MKPTKHSLGIFHMKMLGPKKKGKRKRGWENLFKEEEKN
jgi:hypothetical protein